MTKVKIRGERSIETKLLRLSCELREDARRVRHDHADRPGLANSLDDIAKAMSRVVDALMRHTDHNNVTNRQIGDYVIYSERQNEAPFFVRMAGDNKAVSGPHLNITNAVRSVVSLQKADARRGS